MYGVPPSTNHTTINAYPTTSPLQPFRRAQPALTRDEIVPTRSGMRDCLLKVTV